MVDRVNNKVDDGLPKEQEVRVVTSPPSQLSSSCVCIRVTSPNDGYLKRVRNLQKNQFVIRLNRLSKHLNRLALSRKRIK